jgi:tetratricopeptide (TPR) repeat protein
MDAPSPHIAELYALAEAYNANADVYNAVKLYRRILKLAPEWLPPWQRLAAIYKARGEWKPLMHYAKNAVSLNATEPQLWWDLGIAAAALGKDRLARSVWNKFAPGETPKNKLISLQLRHSGLFELIWARPIDPVRAQITSIPHPDSGRRFMDIVFHDREILGYNVARKRRYPVYAELGLHRTALFQTWSCWLEAPEAKDLQTLEDLCRENGLGFEIWSSASRSPQFKGEGELPEFYSQEILGPSTNTDVQVALAARRPEHLEQTLHAWTIISLKQYYDLQRF